LNLPIVDTPLTARMDEQLRKESREALLVDLIRGRSDTAPLLLVVEDAHWLDLLSQDLLTALGRAIYNLPVAILVAYRPLELARRLPLPVTALPYFTEVVLYELPAAAARQVVATRLAALLPADAPAPEAAVAQVAERARGNPFYLEELVSYLVE